MGSSRAVTGTALALALSLGLAACTAANGSSSPEASPTSPRATASTSPSDTPPEPTAQDQAAALWTSVHDLRLSLVYGDDEPDGDAFATVASTEASETLLALVRAARGDIPTELAEVEYWPDVTVAADGTASIADCILVATQPQDSADDPTVLTQVWTGTAEESDGDWQLTGVTVGESNCVPSELSRQLLDAYRAWHEAKNQWWDPPDPDHPLLDELMVDPGLTDMRDVLDEHRSMGIVVRDAHDLSNAVVFDLAIGRARVSDCFPAAPGNITAYDAETGERREDLSPTPSEGQIDRTVVDFERVAEGVWKANGWRSTSNNDCTPGGGPYVVGP